MMKWLKKKNNLSNKFFILFICVSIVPIIAIMTYVSNVTLKLMTENKEQASISQLKNADVVIYEKSKNIMNFLNSACMDMDVQKILTEDTEEKELFEERIKRYAVEAEDVLGAVFVNKKGASYSYNIDMDEQELLRMKMVYSTVGNGTNAINWYTDFSNMENDKKNNVIGVYDCSSYDKNGDYVHIARIYVYIKSNIFRDAFTDVGNDAVIMFNGDGKRLSVIGQSEYAYMLNNDITLFEDLFTYSEGVVKENKKLEEEFLVVHYTSAITKFKYVKIYDTNQMYKEINKMKYYFTSLMGLLLLIMIAAYFTIMKKIVKPIQTTANYMKNLSWERLNSRLSFKCAGEIEDVVNGYNRLLDKIADMIEEVKEKEQQKKNAEIMALNYQINPHFLYNSLAAIRILALKNGDKEVAAALSDISKIAKNIVSYSSEYITVEEEVALLDSFINLIGLRYRGRINFTIDYDSRINNILIPRMIIQPLIENAVMHGVAPKLKDDDFKPVINISLRLDKTEEANKLYINVIDNGMGINEDRIKEIMQGEGKRKSGIGMQNIDKRIKLIYGEEYGVFIESVIGEETKIELIIPLE